MLKNLALILVSLSLVTVSACAVYSGYAALSPEEKAEYQQKADHLSIDDRMHYLSIKDPKERQAFLDSKSKPNLVTAAPASTSLFPDKAFPTSSKPKPPSAVISAPPAASIPPVAQPETTANPFMTTVPEEDVFSITPVPNPQSASEPKAKAPVAPTPMDTAKVEPIAPPAATAPAAVVPPRVDYQKTGDPVDDVLKLLELYDSGKITKEQFEYEKAMALRQANK